MLSVFSNKFETMFSFFFFGRLGGFLFVVVSAVLFVLVFFNCGPFYFPKVFCNLDWPPIRSISYRFELEADFNF